MSKKFVTDGEFVVLEYGNAVTMTNFMAHSTMGFICPNSDTCKICNWKPTPTPFRVKIKRLPRLMRLKLAYRIYKLAEKLGFRYECEHDSDY